MIYLVSPYSHPDPDVRELRYQAALKYTAVKLGEGEVIFSPIVYGHQVATQHGAPTDFVAWQHFNDSMVALADEVRILKLHGWSDSLGVLHEIQFALDLDITVTYEDFSY